MSMEALRAAQAYADAINAASGGARGPGGPAAGADKPDFSTMVQGALTDARETVAVGEAASAAAVTGDASLVDVVTAVSAAEVALQTVVSVRDKMVQAYQEIMRMPI